MHPSRPGAYMLPVLLRLPGLPPCPCPCPQNHYTWSLGEPAFLKYWLEQPATLRSAAALEQEEGFSQVCWALVPGGGGLTAMRPGPATGHLQPAMVRSFAAPGCTQPFPAHLDIPT